MRPVLEGLCSFESLKDGTLDISDIALMNDALDVRADNDEIAAERLRRRKEVKARG
jgi:hypothetical protein